MDDLSDARCRRGCGRSSPPEVGPNFAHVAAVHHEEERWLAVFNRKGAGVVLCRLSRSQHHLISARCAALCVTRFGLCGILRGQQDLVGSDPPEAFASVINASSLFVPVVSPVARNHSRHKRSQQEIDTRMSTEIDCTRFADRSRWGGQSGQCSCRGGSSQEVRLALDTCCGFIAAKAVRY
jgi:hypothetical protein